ncbi:MAG: nicotinate (nicotinamide) nucleotide adenylyltransferase [Ruminococcus sp.]|nr:nicotinate (nicotinamide) nucleotide adenylyltransferase [Ruminococcus sp.]
MRIGIYGGSFNPVHKGHIHLAKAAADSFGLDRVFLVPSKVSPHRSSAEYAPEPDRIAMLALACAEDERLRVSSFELDSDRISYSVYTVRYFRSLYPDSQIWLLMGSDMLLTFDQWKSWQDIMKEAVIGAVSRNGGDLPQLEAKAEELSKYGRVELSRSAPVEVSSSEIRKKIENNEDFACYLSENVVQYIRYRGLYGSCQNI